MSARAHGRATGRRWRGTHYSVLRAIVFHNRLGKPLTKGYCVNFAVIWDEDHDTRVMEPIEEIYCRGLLSSFAMFGESKGFFTAILEEHLGRYLQAPKGRTILGTKERIEFLPTEINAICQSLDDPWPSKVVGLGSANNPIIAKNPLISDDDENVSLYLKNLEMLWRLGGIGTAEPAALVTANSHRIVPLKRPAVDTGIAPGWTTDPLEADRDAF
jgi:hypothetical protein